MTQFNHDGYVVRLPDGTLLHDSHVSAYSHRRAVTNSVLEPVPAVPGLYVRATARELAEMPDSERAYVHEGAIAWAERFDLPTVSAGVADETPETGEEVIQVDHDDTVELTIDDVTLEELVEMARELDIPGRSKMDKSALFEAVRQAAGVQS